MCREYGDGLADPLEQTALHRLLLEMTRTHFKENIKMLLEKYADSDGAVSSQLALLC